MLRVGFEPTQSLTTRNPTTFSVKMHLRHRGHLSLAPWTTRASQRDFIRSVRIINIGKSYLCIFEFLNITPINFRLWCIFDAYFFASGCLQLEL